MKRVTKVLLTSGRAGVRTQAIRLQSTGPPPNPRSNPPHVFLRSLLSTPGPFGSRRRALVDRREPGSHHRLGVWQTMNVFPWLYILLLLVCSITCF